MTVLILSLPQLPKGFMQKSQVTLFVFMLTCLITTPGSIALADGALKDFDELGHVNSNLNDEISSPPDTNPIGVKPAGVKSRTVQSSALLSKEVRQGVAQKNSRLLLQQDKQLTFWLEEINQDLQFLEQAKMPPVFSDHDALVSAINEEYQRVLSTTTHALSGQKARRLVGVDAGNSSVQTAQKSATGRTRIIWSGRIVKKSLRRFISKRKRSFISRRKMYFE